jgi:hypothetical protein
MFGSGLHCNDVIVKGKVDSPLNEQFSKKGLRPVSENGLFAANTTLKLSRGGNALIIF